MDDYEVDIFFEALSGSRLYGTNREESDWDYRGVAFGPHTSLLLGPKFEQHTEKEPDRVIYSISKFFDLAMGANPNIIELLFIPEKYWTVGSGLWREIVAMAPIFLSRKVKTTFLGYAQAQLQKVKNHRDWLVNPPTPPERGEFGLSEVSAFSQSTIKTLLSLPPEEVDVDALVGDGILEREREFSNASKRWEGYQNWQKNRSPKRQELEGKFGYDTKHALHLVRLLRMGKELLSTGNLTVDRREVDAEELVGIMNGAWSYEKLLEYAEGQEEEIRKILPLSPLPDRPNVREIRSTLYRILCDYYGIDQDRAFASCLVKKGSFVREVKPLFTEFKER